MDKNIKSEQMEKSKSSNGKSYKEGLKYFYNLEAKKYYNTRNKHRSDWELITKIVQEDTNQKIRILELWCGSWRFCTYLNKNLNKKFDYIWVDISENLLAFAQKDNPENKFVCHDMISFTESLESESFDYIISIASFQHIPDNKERKELLDNCNKALKNWWNFISINRSFSHWFIKKYWQSLLGWIIKYIFSIWEYLRNDLLIPWKSEWIVFKRFYHIFSLKELKYLVQSSWFHIEKLWYLNKTWEITDRRNTSSNSLLIVKKK